MKRDRKNAREEIEKSLGLYGKPSQHEIQSAVDGVWQRLQPHAHASLEDDVQSVRPHPARRPARFWQPAWGAVGAFAILAMLSIVIVRNFAWSDGSPATVETAENGLHRVRDGRTQSLQAGESIAFDEIVRSNGGTGGVLVLKDGSRIEVRSRSELALQMAEDGLRIRLNAGSVIVTAARQRSGHLYVQTKDLTVSVVGTVFLVNTEETGSRVAVIEGEVHVQQGPAEKKLRPGEQVATSPLMASQPVIEEISWSRHVEEHLAMLRQSVTIETIQIVSAAPAVPMQESLERFETASIRRSAPASQGTRGGGAAGAPPRGLPCFQRSGLQITPGRFIATRTTLHALIAAAYGVTCLPSYGISGEPDWSRTEAYDIEAVTPPGSPVYSRYDVAEGNAPRLQRMLQNLLADRFRLVVRREMKEMPAYNLVIVKPGTWECHTPPTCRGLKLSENQDPEAPSTGTGPGPIVFTSLAPRVSIAKWAKENASNMMDRPVMDGTALKGLYDIRLEYFGLLEPGAATSVEEIGRLMEANAMRMKDQFSATIQDQLGFRLEPTTALVEVIVIEHVEKPFPN